MQTYTINIRPRRQATLPSPILKKFGVGVGDSLVASIQKNKIVLFPQKNIALDALSEIKKIVRESVVSEKDTLKSLAKIRKDFYAERYS